MFEKVNPSHPDKIADRIAGALVDLAYTKAIAPRIAVEVLIGHGCCHVIAETSCHLKKKEVRSIVYRIVGKTVAVDYVEVPQDTHLADNQEGKFRCGDNGIFKGVPVGNDEKTLTHFAENLYESYPYDGKFIIDKKRIIVCQSHAEKHELAKICDNYFSKSEVVINPLGYWTGGINVDSGATNRKLGSDMGRSVTGGGLHGKDLTKADVSVNIYAWLKAQQTNQIVRLSCAIGDEYIDGKPYGEIVAIAKDFINKIGGFEKFAEWGLIRD